MATNDSALRTDFSNGTTHALTVIGTTEDGAILAGDNGTGEPFVCDLLQTSCLPPLVPQRDDTVLVLILDAENRRGAILGKIVPASAAQPSEITLRCGQSAIILEESGRILTRGQDIVSHARHANRIKGAAVAIN